jgi:hypothetical protein
MRNQFLKKCMFLLACIVYFLASATFAQDFTGSRKCGLCHKGAAKGSQLEKWDASKHSKSFATLGTPKAFEIAAKAGVDKGNIKTDAKCTKCHITSAGFATEGVGCESCHGAGSKYSPMAIMKDKVKAKANGLKDPGEATCKTCHNATGPHAQKPFVYGEFWKSIAHKKA